MPYRFVAPAFLALLALASTAAGARAEGAQPKPPRNKYGSPLDTLMSTRLWTTVPPAKDFVRNSRPDPATLDYTPLTGADPDRPKPRDTANVEALRAELEHDRAQTVQQGKTVHPAAKIRPRAKSVE